MKKRLYIFLGSISLFFGFLGVFTPGIPTTPFVLLTGYLFARSSPSLYAKLQRNKFTGAVLRRVDEGLSWQMRLFSIALMWTMVALTAFFVFEGEDVMRYVMLSLGAVGTIAQLIALRKKPKLRTALVSDAAIESENAGRRENHDTQNI